MSSAGEQPKDEGREKKRKKSRSGGQGWEVAAPEFRAAPILEPRRAAAVRV